MNAPKKRGADSPPSDVAELAAIADDPSDDRRRQVITPIEETP